MGAILADMAINLIRSLVAPDDAARAIGARLRAHRLAQNRSQREVAERAGVSVPTVKRLEAEGRGSIEHLLLVAWTLGLEAAFVDLVPKPAPGSIEEVASPRRRQRASTLRKAG